MASCALLTLPLALQWLANPANDMYADTVTTVVLEVQSNPRIRKGTESSVFFLLPLHLSVNSSASMMF